MADELATLERNGTPRRFGWMGVGLALAALALVGCFAFLAGRLKANDAPATEKADAATAKTSYRANERRIVVPGKVEPIDGQLNLAFDTPGVLRNLAVEEGQWVDKGKLLAELVNDEIQARLDAAKHEAERATARMTMLDNGSRKEDIEEARADLNRTTEWVGYFERLVAARESLQKQRAIAVEELLEFRQRFAEAQKQRDAANARLNRLLAGARQEEKDMARAEAAGAQARVRELAAALERSRLRAPRDGKILRVLRREGESVMGVEASPVILLADILRLQIRAEVDERQVEFVKVGGNVRFNVFGSTGRIHDAKIVRINGLMGRKTIASDDPREKFDTRVFEIIIDVPDPKAVLVNQRVDVTVLE